MNEKSELLKTTIEHLEYLQSEGREAVAMLRRGAETEGTSKIAKFVDEISITLEALEITKDIQKELIETSMLNDLLATAIEGLENGDFILVADVFEYELLELLANWEKSLSENFA